MTIALTGETDVGSAEEHPTRDSQPRTPNRLTGMDSLLMLSIPYRNLQDDSEFLPCLKKPNKNSLAKRILYHLDPENQAPKKRQYH
jgi:hypothetical protein